VRITIITVCYNCKDDIESTILSVINQTHQNIEYIIIDGGSTDGTLKVIKKYLNKINMLVSEPDKGIFDAMNKGLMHATGEWVNFMNAGDEFHDFFVLEKIFSTTDHNGIGILYGSTRSNNSILQPDKLNSLKYGGIMACHQSIFYNREVCGGELFYKTEHKHYGDIELTRRLYIKGVPFKQVNVTIANYKGGGFSSIISLVARKAKFSYLYQNFGLLGIFYGIVGKGYFLYQKYLNSINDIYSKATTYEKRN